MLTEQELEKLLTDLESDRVERKESLSDPSKLRQAICAFANDMPDHRQPGILFIGVTDEGKLAKLPITDQMLRTLADMRSDGNILPLPTMTVQKRTLLGAEIAVVEVEPAYAPPVRYHGLVWIRVGPRRAIASLEEERRLDEKRRTCDLPFDLSPVLSASMDDLDDMYFRREYLPMAVAPEVLEQNQRTLEQQLSSLRFITSEPPRRPTHVGMLVLGKSPSDFIPGAYVQFLRIDGSLLTDPVANQKELHGPIPDLLRRIEEIIEANISTATDFTTASVEIRWPDYPMVALQQLARNAVMHRDYQTTNAPVRITWFRDRIEIQNPGGPFGQVTQANFGTPGITDYRNPHLAEALKTLGFVQRFGVGIALAKKSLHDNGNPVVEFSVEANHVSAVVRRRP